LRFAKGYESAGHRPIIDQSAMAHDDPIGEDHGKFSRHFRAIGPRHLDAEREGGRAALHRHVKPAILDRVVPGSRDLSGFGL
jgi:hypothetical protein